jgi:hypothetical protein
VSMCSNPKCRVIALAVLVSACGDSSKDTAGAPMTLDSASGAGGSGDTAAGSGGTGGQGGAAAEGGEPANPDDMGNHFASGDWQGYFWTSTQGDGTTITPMNFSMQTGGMPRCVKGSVAMTSDYSGVAILGVNLNETSEGKMTVTPSKAGVDIALQNKGGTGLLFQVEGDGTRWCAQLKASGGFIQWSKLNTACWDNSGKNYNDEPIVSAALVVPGNNTAAVPFDFCLNRLAESDGP